VSRPKFEAVFFGGGRSGEEAGRHDLIPFAMNDQWEWVVPHEIETFEHPGGRLTGRYVLRRNMAELPTYDWFAA
jgi:hypothetical protein